MKQPKAITKSRKILLTGATGFVGAEILSGLLERTDASIVCLVRPTCLGSDRHVRLLKRCREIGIDEQKFQARVEVVYGALDRNQLGIRTPDYKRLIEEVDTVFHLGAKLNYLLPLWALSDVNVGGTRRVLEFVKAGRSKSLHYMSTSGVYMSLDALEHGYLSRDVPLSSYSRHVIGYFHSKWQAEQLLGAAREEGQSVVIYRPSFVGGTLASGYLPESDLTRQFLRACNEVQAVPQIDFTIDIVPVDVLSKAVINLAVRDDQDRFDVNLCNPEPGSLLQMAPAFPDVNGRPIRPVSYEEWCQLLRRGYPSFAKNLMRWATRPTREVPQGLLRQFADVPRALPESIDMAYALKGSGLVCPPADDAMLLSYLGGMGKSKSA